MTKIYREIVSQNTFLKYNSKDNYPTDKGSVSNLTKFTFSLSFVKFTENHPLTNLFQIKNTRVKKIHLRIFTFEISLWSYRVRCMGLVVNHYGLKILTVKELINTGLVEDYINNY